MLKHKTLKVLVTPSPACSVHKWPIVWLLRAPEGPVGGEWHYPLWSYDSLLTSSLSSSPHFPVWWSMFLSNYWQYCSILTLTVYPNKYSSVMCWVASLWFGRVYGWTIPVLALKSIRKNELNEKEWRDVF